MWYCLCDEMDVIYMRYIVFVMSQMLYISLICCVCEYRIKKKLASLPSALTLAEFPALPSARARALGKEITKKKLKNICRAPTWQGTRQRNY